MNTTESKAVGFRKKLDQLRAEQAALTEEARQRSHLKEIEKQYLTILSDVDAAVSRLCDSMTVEELLPEVIERLRGEGFTVTHDEGCDEDCQDPFWKISW